MAAVEAVPGVRLVNDETRLVPEAKPFVWSAERDVVRVTLGGSSPLPASKGKLLDAARAELGGVEVVDQMNLSRGAPARFDDAALLLLDQIGKLKDGKITLSDTKVSLSGMARDLGGREAIAAALKNLPEGFSVAANEIKAPPYIFQAYKDPVAVTLTLSGYVPDNNVHAALVAAAGAKILQRKGGRQSQGQRRRALRICQRRGGGAGRAVAAVDRNAGGVGPRSEAVGRCASMTLRGGPDPRRPRQGFSARAGSSRPTFRSSPRPRRWMPPSASNCSRICSRKGKIRFESGRATIDPDSAGLLDRLIETALRCPTANIEIAGHTDADGEDAFNQTLSEKRAQAVTDYLVKAGTARRPLHRGRAMAAPSRSPATTPTKARRKTAASNSW